MSIIREYRKEKVSIVGSIISFVGVVFNKFVPTKIPIASQSVFDSVNAGLVYISLGMISVVSLVIFFTIGFVRAHKRHKRSR